MKTAFFLASFVIYTITASSGGVIANNAPKNRIKPDSSQKTFKMQAVSISSTKSGAVNSIPHIEGTALYSGKKTERINLRGMAANTALNNTRQIFAQSPGVFIWENDGSGIQANVGVRGLSPNRSWEFNVRQNGYDISSDPFGYPEAYYTPPFEMVETIDIVRGASSLQYGPQFGGLLNYVTKSAPQNKEFGIESSQMIGSGNLYSTYTGLGGTLKMPTNEAFDYYVGGFYKRGDGWRQHNRFEQVAGIVKLGYSWASASRLGVELTGMTYVLQQPSGLTEAQYAQNPQQAFRARDWFSTPWFVAALTFDHEFSTSSRLSIKAFGLLGERNSVGLTTSTAIEDNGANRRRVNHDGYGNFGIEARLLNEMNLGGLPIALASGVRFSRGNTLRKQGRGFDGSDVNFSFAAPLTRDLSFIVVNAAAFVEAKISITDNISLTPGFRLERIASFGSGAFTREYGASTVKAFDTLGAPTVVNAAFTEYVPLAGIGLSAYLAPSLFPSLELYANFSQAYRPALFGDQFQTDLTAVDPNLRSSMGFSSDIGLRGSISTAVRWDVSAFFVRYNDRVGVLPASILTSDERLRLVSGATALRTNIAASQHIGVEFLVDADIFRSLGAQLLASQIGSPSVFVSASYTDAQYVGDIRAERSQSGMTSVQNLIGNRVEFAPEWMLRSGLTYTFRDIVTMTFQYSYVGKSFSNAANTISQADGQQGVIPEYSVADLSLCWKALEWLSVEGSINNLFDNRYFTRRGTGYPGPGIIPADGRMWTAGIRMTL